MSEIHDQNEVEITNYRRQSIVDFTFSLFGNFSVIDVVDREKFVQFVSLFIGFYKPQFSDRSEFLAPNENVTFLRKKFSQRPGRRMLMILFGPYRKVMKRRSAKME